MHRKRPTFLTDMGLLMFLAVTASLLGYCQTDEKGKTQRRDSRPRFAYHIPYLLPFLIFLPRARVSLSTPAAAAASKEIRISLSASSNSDEGEGTRENSAVREKERRRLTFMAAGMSSSREFTYSESGLMVAAHIHCRSAFNSARDHSALHPAWRPFVNTPARMIISGTSRASLLTLNPRIVGRWLKVTVFRAKAF